MDTIGSFGRSEEQAHHASLGGMPPGTQTYVTLPHFVNEKACTDAGGVATTDAATNTITCNIEPVTKRPSLFTFGLSVVGALVVGAVAGSMYQSTKGNR